MTRIASTIVLPTEDSAEVDDTRRLKLMAGIGGAMFLVLLIFIWALWPGKKNPRPAGTPLAAATGAPSVDNPESNDPLDFVAAAKPPLVQRSPTPDSDGPPPVEETPTDGPTEDPTAWAKHNKVQVYSKHGLNQPVVRSLAAGERVIWVEDYQNWTRVKLLGKGEGWVERKSLIYTEPEYAQKPTPEEGRQTLSDFYAEVARKDYASAYARLSNEWKAELSYTDFVKGFKQVRSLDLQLGETEVMSGTNIRQHVVIEADEEARPRRFRGTYELQYQPIEWRLTSGILEEGGPTNSSVPGL